MIFVLICELTSSFCLLEVSKSARYEKLENVTLAHKVEVEVVPLVGMLRFFQQPSEVNNTCHFMTGE